MGCDNYTCRLNIAISIRRPHTETVVATGKSRQNISDKTDRIGSMTKKVIRNFRRWNKKFSKKGHLKKFGREIFSVLPNSAPSLPLCSQPSCLSQLFTSWPCASFIPFLFHSNTCRATGNSCFEGDRFPVLFWKNCKNSRLELMTYLQANMFIFARKWPKLTHFYQLHKTQ